MTEEVDQNFEALLEYLRQNRGFDFTGYKRPSLTRRVSKRMQDIQIETFENYVDYLEVHPEEFSHLFDTILINNLNAPPTGAGETTITIISAAIANAIYDATGVRMRQIPFPPANFLAAKAAQKV